MNERDLKIRKIQRKMEINSLKKEIEDGKESHAIKSILFGIMALSLGALTLNNAYDLMLPQLAQIPMPDIKEGLDKFLQNLHIVYGVTLMGGVIETLFGGTITVMGAIAALKAHKESQKYERRNEKLQERINDMDEEEIGPFITETTRRSK